MVELEAHPRMMCTNRGIGEYRVSYTMPHDVKAARLHFAITGESGSSTGLSIASAGKISGPDAASVSVKNGRVVIENPAKGQPLCIRVRFEKSEFSFDHYCTMEVNHYENNK